MKIVTLPPGLRVDRHAGCPPTDAAGRRTVVTHQYPQTALPAR